VTRDELAPVCRRVLEGAWDPAGYTAPNPERYPWQWLWDSCFHAIVWAHLGDDRGLVELGRLLKARDGEGFVPHIIYAPHWNPHELFWGRVSMSSITQPPMHGHALAELVRLGVDVPDQLLAASKDALRFLLRTRERHSSGLIRLCHPWESGADDSPRWDHWYGDDRFRVKGELLHAVVRSEGGAPVANDDFDVAPASFNALVAFNAHELAGVTDDESLERAADELAQTLDTQWDDAFRTWVDAGESAAGSGAIGTLDALLGTLVSTDRSHVDAALDDVSDPAAHGGRYGPTGVHRDEETFEPDSYWRGSAWPQLSYLLWVAADRAGRADVADRIAASTVDAAVASGFAEHWDPDNAAALGAIPQSWTTLALLMA
jgi:hypothetical protein